MSRSERGAGSDYIVTKQIDGKAKLKLLRIDISCVKLTMDK